jgi:hypothetical protein
LPAVQARQVDELIGLNPTFACLDSDNRGPGHTYLVRDVLLGKPRTPPGVFQSGR